MSDPYLNFDKDNDLSNIQVNVYRVRNSLLNASIEEKKKILKGEVTIFNSKTNKLEIDGEKVKGKLVDTKIYLTDTIEILLNKIANNCCKDENITGMDIFSWIDMNPKDNPSLRFCYPLGINYEDDENKFMNPYYSDKDYDNRFVSDSGEIKKDSKYNLDLYSSYGSYYSLMKDYKFVKPRYDIYFCTINDLLEYIPSSPLKDLSENHIFYGYLKKYFPLFNKFSEINDENRKKKYRDNFNKKIMILDSQKQIQDESLECEIIDCRPETLIYRNKIEMNSINLLKIFKDFELSNKIPYLKIQIDSYLESYIKFNKDEINTKFNFDKKKTVTKEIFERWNKGISINNGFTMPKYVDKTNTLSFIIYDLNTTNYVTMILYSDGLVEMYCEKLMRIENFTNDFTLKFINECNHVLKQINSGNYSDNNIHIPYLYNFPKMINISYLYDISDYNPKILLKPFKKLYSEFLVIEEDSEVPLHLLYMKNSNCKNIKNIQPFITKMKKKKIEDDKIIELLNVRFGIQKDKCRDELSDWNRVFDEKGYPKYKDLDDISILIQKVLDRIKVTLLGVTSYGELHELMKTVSFIMGIYKKKKIDKEKDIPEEINDLFKKTSEKEILSFSKTDQIIEKVEKVKTEIVTIKESVTDDMKPEDKERVSEYKEDKEAIEDDKVVEDEEGDDSESESESDDEDSYGRISSSSESSSEGGGIIKGGSMKGGGVEEDESKYPNKRYYISRLEQRDPKLIKFKPRNKDEAYARKCPATVDKQPIILTEDELDEIDHKVPLTDEQKKRRNEKFRDSEYKPRWNHEGISYSKPLKIEGPGRPELYFICPKYWDRKHQIPLDPLDKMHPIEKVDYTPFIYSKEMKKDSDCFILERSGRKANGIDKDSYWNRDEKDRNNIDKYNVQFIHDDVHPDLLPLPCCGKRPVTYSNNTYVNVLMNSSDERPYWEVGRVVGNINNDDEYPISIQKSGEWLESKYYHISLLKEFKGSLDRLSNEMPLKRNSKGHVHPILKDLFHIRKEDPKLNKNTNNGFYRIGVQQTGDAFLECLEVIHITNRTNKNIKRNRLNMESFKKYIIEDINNPNFDLFKVGGGSFVQYFRDEKIIDKSNQNDSIRNSVINNFKNYLFSNEPKEDYLLIPLIQDISRLNKNKTFEDIRLNIFVLSEKNETIRIEEPIGKFDYSEEYNFCFVYKQGSYYEPLIYHYENANYGYIEYKNDLLKLKKGDDILCNDTIGKIININKDIIKISLKDTDEIVTIDNNSSIIKYDMKCLIDQLLNIINVTKSKSQITTNEYISEEELHIVMNKLGYIPLNKGYYDTYNRLSVVEYKEMIGKKFKRIILPIKTKALSEESYQEKIFPISNIPKLSIDAVLKYLKKIDLEIHKLYENKFNKYLDGNEKIIINHKDKTYGLYLSRGIIIPLTEMKYNYQKYKIETIINTNLLDMQNNYLLGNVMEDEMTEYFDEYNEINDILYEKFSSVYTEIINNKLLKNSTEKILNNPIKLLIHKRWELYDLYTINEKITIKDRELKQFIECLIINGLDELNKLFIHSFISLKDIKINNTSTKDIILSTKDLLNGLHDNYFEGESNYIRNISFYEEYDPKINKILMKREKIEQEVSLYNKYPNIMNKLFIGNVKVNKNTISEESNDIYILHEKLLELYPMINPLEIREYLITQYSSNKTSYEYQNLMKTNKYKTNEELLYDLDDPNYYLTPYDYKMLSLKYNIGFILYTNRYTGAGNKFQSLIIIHNDLIHDEMKKLSIKMIAFYQDFGDDEMNNKEIKNIEVNNEIILNYQDLYRNSYFRKILMKTYKLKS